MPSRALPEKAEKPRPFVGMEVQSASRCSRFNASRRLQRMRSAAALRPRIGNKPDENSRRRVPHRSTCSIVPGSRRRSSRGISPPACGRRHSESRPVGRFSMRSHADISPEQRDESTGPGGYLSLLSLLCSPISCPTTAPPAPPTSAPSHG
jgi:hypothetical protein